MITLHTIKNEKKFAVEQGNGEFVTFNLEPYIQVGTNLHINMGNDIVRQATVTQIIVDGDTFTVTWDINLT